MSAMIAMSAAPQGAVVRRVGAVLIVLGLLDIGLAMYCIANEIAYSSSLNIFAVIAGVFLRRGSMRAVRIVRAFALFLLTACGSLLLVFPFLQPWELSMMQMRLAGGAVLGGAAVLASVLALLCWVVRALGSESVQAELVRTGGKRSASRLPVAAGVVLVASVAWGVLAMTGGQDGARALQLARDALGPGYRYHVSEISFRSGGGRSATRASVTAWNTDEIRIVPVAWDEATE